jgi:hypothetical protein
MVRNGFGLIYLARNIWFGLDLGWFSHVGFRSCVSWVWFGLIHLFGLFWVDGSIKPHLFTSSLSFTSPPPST